MIPGLVRAAIPCPPPLVSAAGGTSASTSCPTGSSSSYSTNFNLTENPISEGGKWVNGKAVGLDWNNAQSVPGAAYGADYATGYNDPIAVLNTSFTPNQFAQGTVRRVAGYSPGVSHEVELLLRFQVTAGNARGYEVLYSHDGWLVIVRWNGPLGNYAEVASSGRPVSGNAADGDVIRAEITGGVIKVYKNGSLVLTGSDTTWTNGQPGMGFWPKPGATIQSYGWRSYMAGSL
jgi:hypothetical protein